MKKTINAGIGGRNFTIDEDAYSRLDAYLGAFKARLKDVTVSEVMDDLESRIAELFTEKVGSGARVVDLALVEEVITQLGMPDGSPVPGGAGTSGTAGAKSAAAAPRKLFRDPAGARVAGVCAGLAHYFDIDVSLVRILMLVAVFAATAGFWIYIVLWIVVPKALTPAQQCEMRGLVPSAENMAKYSSSALKTR